jgi:two-component system response regulator YesN
MKHVLIVDDDANVAGLIAAALRSYTVTVAHNGPEALARAAQLPACDLLIADYLMPAMPGTVLADRLRERQPALKTVLISGFGSLIDVNGAGTDAWLAKPFCVGDLRRLVTRLIG